MANSIHRRRPDRMTVRTRRVDRPITILLLHRACRRIFRRAVSFRGFTSSTGSSAQLGGRTMPLNHSAMRFPGMRRSGRVPRAAIAEPLEGRLALASAAGVENVLLPQFIAQLGNGGNELPASDAWWALRSQRNMA